MRFSWKDKRRLFPEFRAGSVVKFVLDLYRNGTLSVSVDGGAMVELFDRSVGCWHDYPSKPLVVSALQLSGTCGIRFLGFESE